MNKTFTMMSWSMYDLLEGKKVQWFLPGKKKWPIICMYQTNYRAFDFVFRVKGDMLEVKLWRR